ncbi:MAG TPA: hypothetical protein VI076_07810, partial [Actinopolymorphaceae bacterium]
MTTSAGEGRGERNRASGWRADPAVVARWEQQRPGLLFDEAKVGPYELPDPLRCTDGSVVASPEDWARRREEILELFRAQVYGRRPVSSPDRRHRQTYEIVEDDPTAMDGAATLRRVMISTAHPDPGREAHRFEVVVFLPNDVPDVVPVFLLLDNRGPEHTDPTRELRSGFWPAEEVVAKGYGIAALHVRDLAPDDAATFT